VSEPRKLSLSQPQLPVRRSRYIYPLTRLTGYCRSTSSLLPLLSDSTTPSSSTSTHGPFLTAHLRRTSSRRTVKYGHLTLEFHCLRHRSVNLELAPRAYVDVGEIFIRRMQVGQLIRAEREGEYISPPLSRCMLCPHNHSLT
jgi:hypothetical protein